MKEMSMPDVIYEVTRGLGAVVNKETTWVEREVPEHLEDAAHDLITTLLKSHGYNWHGEKQNDNDT